MTVTATTTGLPERNGPYGIRQELGRAAWASSSAVACPRAYPPLPNTRTSTVVSHGT